jgi:hypothetical protein
MPVLTHLDRSRAVSPSTVSKSSRTRAIRSSAWPALLTSTSCAMVVVRAAETGTGGAPTASPPLADAAAPELPPYPRSTIGEVEGAHAPPLREVAVWELGRGGGGGGAPGAPSGVFTSHLTSTSAPPVVLLAICNRTQKHTKSRGEGGGTSQHDGPDEEGAAPAFTQQG